MLETLISVFAVSSIAAVLAAALVLAERFISNYGECAIDINAGERVLNVQGGSSLLEALTRNEIFIPSACGGRGTCAYCKLKVLEGAGPLLPTEEPYLDAAQREEGVRLSCQVKVRNDLSIEIPRELLAVREYQCRCLDIKDLTYDIKQFRFELQEPTEISFTPGQYVQMLAPEYEGNKEEVYRAYSISCDPKEEGCIELIIRLLPNGICTSYLFNHLKVGDQVRINGPYGEFHLSDTEAPIIFVAGGSGMAPIKCMLHHMVNINCTRPAIYFFGVNTLKDIYFVDEMKAFESQLANYRFLPVVARPEEGSGWTGETGLVTEALGRQIDDMSQYEAYLCGSPGMLDATIKVLTERGMPLENIFYDKFA